MANSYLSPTYDALEAGLEKEYGLPKGLMASIRTKGERSNADQVSEAGARTVYQIIPDTRASVLQKYKVDAYASPKDAARAAALILRENLKASGGSIAGAAARYHGGNDQRQWGKRTRAYVARVTKGGDPSSADGGSTYDRVKARQRAVQEDLSRFPDIRTVAASPLKKSVQIPDAVIQSYNTHRMTDEDRAIVDKGVKDGTWFVPKGAKLTRPDPRTAGDMVGMGVRNVMTGAGNLVDVVARPLNQTINAVTGAGLNISPGATMANSAADAMGLAKPESDAELMNAAAQEGVTQGLATYGLGTALKGAQGATGIIAETLAANPVLDTVSAATSNVAGETARQAGAGPVGQTMAALAGGMVPVGAAGTVGRIRAPKSVPEVVESVPRSAVMDEAGNLTPDGQELAARHGITPEDLKTAYDTAPPRVQEGTANDQMPEAQAKVAGDRPLPEEVAAPEPVTRPEAPPVRPVETAPPATPEAMPATAKTRVDQAGEFGIPMSRGQATKNFDIQDQEQRLRNSNGPEGEEMRQFAARQTEQVKAAVDDFKAAVGNKDMSPEERGIAVQEAIRDLRDNGKAGVSALYNQAKELGADVGLDTTGIRQTYEGLMAEADIPDQVKNFLTQEAARYGLIGKPVVFDEATGAVTNEANVTTVQLDNGQTVKFRGEPQRLGLDNAETFRQAVSKQYPVDGPQKLTGELRRAIDDAVENALTDAAAGQATGAEVNAAFGKARAAHKAQKQTFDSKDVVNDIHDWKRGAEGVTSKLSPQQVVDRAFASVTNLKKIKAVLLSNATVKSKAAWNALQAHGVATIFEKAKTQNQNIGGEITDAISGAKLRTAINDFGGKGQGPAMLKVLLDDKDFNTLMRLRGTIEDVTIPISGTVNHSNSGNLMMRLMSDLDNRVTAGFASAGMAVGGPAGAAIGGAVGRTVGPAIKAAKEAKDAARVVEGATNYTPEKAATETAAPGVTPAKPSMAGKVKAAAAGSIKAFIDIYSTPRVLAPVLAAGSQEQ